MPRLRNSSRGNQQWGARVSERAALVDLMKAIARYGRPATLPDDVRAAWDTCERVLGSEAVEEISKVPLIPYIPRKRKVKS